MYRLKGCILEVLGGNMGALFAIDIAACNMGGSGTDGTCDWIFRSADSKTGLITTASTYSIELHMCNHKHV